MLKSHNPDMCSVCSKRHPPNTKHPVKDIVENKPVHVLDSASESAPKKVSRSKSESSHPKPSLHAPNGLSGSSNITRDHLKQAAEGNQDSLLHVLGILEKEFSESKS